MQHSIGYELVLIETGWQVTEIGAGPAAGLSVALSPTSSRVTPTSSAGHLVMIFEAAAQSGGRICYDISGYKERGMSRDVLNAEIQRIPNLSSIRIEISDE